MQATLLSIAIALILALVTALVGPHFVDWNKYRSEFEAQASRMTGLQVRLAGPIEARLLPTPSISLQRVDITRPGDVGSLRARRVSIEFALASQMRGEWKAADVRIDGAEVSFVLDRNGRLEWPAPAVGFDLEAISIERLDIRDSRALLADAASGSSAVLDKLEFNGELRTLAGPVKGQGSFYVAGQHYPYRIAASRVGDERLRLRFNIDPIDRPFTADAEGFISVENGVPRFAGTFTVARPVTRAPSGSQAEILEPWRLTGRIDGTPKRAVIEQIEFQYGPDERPIRLRGDASASFGASSRFVGVLSSPQVDLDRMLSLPEDLRRRPLAAIKNFADYLTGSLRLPIPIDFGISIESLTLAGATLQRVSGDFSTAADGWIIDNLELRAPGMTQVGISGRFNTAGADASFIGRTKIESKDPRAFMSWLTDRSDAQVVAAKSLSLDGTFKFGGGEIAVDRLKAELDRMTLEGRLAYAWSTRDRPPRLEAVISAPDLDLDRAHNLLNGLFDGTVFDWPREGLVSAQIGRATLAGIEALRATVDVRFNAEGLEIQRFAIGDFGGVALDMKGHVDTRAQAPRGSVVLDLDARQLDGAIALIERVSPQTAAAMRSNAARMAPAKLSVTLNLAAGRTATDSKGQFKIAGSAGAFLVSLHGEAGARHEDLTLARLSRLLSSRIDLGGEVAARDGAALMALLRLDRLAAVDKDSARLSFTARGQLDGDLVVDSQLVAGGLDLTAKGNVRLSGSQGGPTAGMDVRIAHAKLRAPPSGDRPTEPLPATLTTRLSLAEGVVGLSELSGKIAGTDVSGRLSIDFAQPLNVKGEISLGAADLPGVIAAAIGMPRAGAGKGNDVGGAWRAEPFEGGLIGSAEGAIKLRVSRVTLSSALTIHDARGVLQFGPASIGVMDIDGSIAGGRLAGSLSFERSGDGVTLASRLRFAGINIADVLPGEGALSGLGTLDLDIGGTGRSPSALIGSLRGEGTFTIQNGRIARLDASAFDSVIRSVDKGLPIDLVRIRERMEAGLDGGVLSMSLAQGEIAIAAGQARLANTAVRVKGAELDLVSASFDLSGGTLDARLSLSVPADPNVPAAPPEITVVLRGPVGAPKRTLDVAAFTNWLALRTIEERAKRIEALEREREALTGPVVPAEPAPVEPSAPANTPSAAAPPPERTPPALESPQQPKQRAQPPRPAPGKPPTDIRPPPAVKLQVPPRQQTQPPAPAAPASRSWLESLFGP